jgi:UDP-apiose/xylose synthase
MTPSCIAVLGAGGFLGSHLVRGLLERFDCDIDAVDVDFEKLDVSAARLRKWRGRVEDSSVLDAVTAQADVVVSLTALCNPAQYSTIPLEVIDANFTHLLPVVKRCAERKIRLIHFSTAEVYGLQAVGPDGLPTREMSEDSSCLQLGPIHKERWSYACAKQLLERVIWAYGEHHRLSFTLIRPFNTIGPRMDFLPGVDGEGTPRVLACFMNQLLRGAPLQLVGGGTQKRAFMDVRDMTEAVCRVIERRCACERQILNLGNPRNLVSIAEFARMLASAFAEIVPDAAPATFQTVRAADFYGLGYDDTAERVPDVGKARRLLGWEPVHSMQAMLPGIVADYVARYRGRVASPVQAARSA